MREPRQCGTAADAGTFPALCFTTKRELLCHIDIASFELHTGHHPQPSCNSPSSTLLIILHLQVCKEFKKQAIEPVYDSQAAILEVCVNYFHATGRGAVQLVQCREGTGL